MIQWIYNYSIFFMETKLTRSKSDLEQVLQAMTTEEKNRNYKEADKLQK